MLGGIEVVSIAPALEMPYLPFALSPYICRFVRTGMLGGAVENAEHACKKDARLWFVAPHRTTRTALEQQGSPDRGEGFRNADPHGAAGTLEIELG